MPSPSFIGANPIQHGSRVAKPMHTFFHGWRRKAGCVTLVMAIAVGGMWARSLVVMDRVWFCRNAQLHHVISFDGVLSWWKRPQTPPSPAIPSLGWSSTTFDELTTVALYQSTWHIQFKTLAIPLTLLSAYLILWKPRKRPPKIAAGIAPPE